MSAQKVWSVKYVAGNPAMFSKVTEADGGPFRRAAALEACEHVARNGWRAWVEHHATGKRIFESEAELQFKRDEEAKRIIEFAKRNVPGFR